MSKHRPRRVHPGIVVALLVAAIAFVTLGFAAGATEPPVRSSPAKAVVIPVPPAWNAEWPVLREYDGDHLRRIAMPLGGIGTGVVSLGGRGDLRDWEIMNRAAKGFRPGNTFFALYAKPASGPAVARVLEGPLDPDDFEGASGARAANHGLPRFRQARFAAAYPLGQVFLADPAVPLRVRIEAFNPLVPGDADASGFPAAVVRFVLINPGDEPVTAAVCGSLENVIGYNGRSGEAKKNVNSFRRQGRIQGLLLSSAGVSGTDENWGTIALAVPSAERATSRSAWKEPYSWNVELADFWEDFAADGELDPRVPTGIDRPQASLAVRGEVPARGSRAFTFVLAWHFPNRQSWTPLKDEEKPLLKRTDVQCCPAPPAPGERRDPNRVGNYYATRFADAWDAAAAFEDGAPALEARTRAFVAAFCGSDFPPEVKEAALFNLSTLRSQTVFRTKDGRLFGFEGTGDTEGCCLGSCTHVWNYEQATAFLFGTLARGMRETEFVYALDPNGMMNFRVSLPLSHKQRWGFAAADGQMGCSMKLYREWQLSGDGEWLKTVWPQARKSIEFAWQPGGWDGDRDGVLEGCQHNTMDVEYYGPNPQMGIWYLGALRATERMARAVGDDAFAGECARLFDQGSRWIDANLWNGEFYVQQIRPFADARQVLLGTSSTREWPADNSPTHPAFQLGDACLVDQMVGQYLARVVGLGDLVDPAHARKTLDSIMRYNFRRGFWDHFNNMRSFVLQDESGILMATWPLGGRPAVPFPYYTEVMTGFEYAANVHMLYEGMTEPGLESIRAIRDRYDGRKRNPFDEAECGHHYARAMASWGATLALSGFRYSAVDRTLEFRAPAAPDRSAEWFWSNGSAWGTVRIETSAGGPAIVRLRAIEGRLAIDSFRLTGAGEKRFEGTLRIEPGREATFEAPAR